MVDFTDTLLVVEEVVIDEGDTRAGELLMMTI